MLHIAHHVQLPGARTLSFSQAVGRGNAANCLRQPAPGGKCRANSPYRSMTTIRINRAPVLTLWASIVAERLGWPHDTALTLGRAVAGMTAHGKGVRLGIFAQPEDREHQPGPSPPVAVVGAIRDVPLLGRIVHVAPTAEGPRAMSNNELVQPQAVERNLRGKFGSQLCAALSAMERLAATVPTDTLNDEAFRLCEHFRPEVPSGEPGWGARGVLDLDRIHALVRTKRQQT